MSKTPAVKYLVFDCESVADAALVAKLRYAEEPDLAPTQAVRRYRDELLAKFETDFIPYTYQVPISVVVAKVDESFRLIDVVALDDPKFRPHRIVQQFWKGWEHYKRPTLVSFNGRTFDLPLLELAAFRYGIALPGWFSLTARTYEQPRNRYNIEAHFDLHDLLTNFGAARFNGGLNLAANLLGKPGKMDVKGDMVQDLHDAGELAQINDYCRCDVLDTYFVFLRSCVLIGKLSLDDEQKLVGTAREWLEARAKETPIYAAYLERWGSWQNPWQGED